MLAETAALRLGTIVANAAGKLWLRGKQRDQERLLSMEELVRVRVPGVRLQREVRQQFEQITNAVYDRLDPYLTHAFDRLEPGGRQAVIDAVADTFARADLSDDALLAADAQPAELVRRITASVRPPTGLGETEARLHEALFAECVAYYVRIVRSLPVFEERAAAELLARTSTLGAEVARILERLPDRSLFAPDGSDLDTDFRRTYLELVSRQLDEVELFRGTSDQASPQRVRLSVAYVSLRTTGGDAQRRRGIRSPRQLRPDMSDWEEGGQEASGMRVEAALRGASRVLLRGEAGSGKTTLLRWLAITAARGGFTDELAEWNGLTPVFVKLRDYTGRKPPNPEAMLDGVAGPITGVMPRGWVERQLAAGNALLLIDGVDELLHRERQEVRDWLRRLLGQYEAVRVVVTSRPAAAGADWLRREDFTALHLDRMTPPDLAAFVRRWHQAVRELCGELPCAVDDIPRYEQSLLTGLKDRAHLQSLASTPLLAAMLCAMHLNRGRHLPQDRMELYRNALHTLVHDRDADRRVPSAADSRLSLGDKLVILRDLAWRLSDNNRTEIDAQRAAGYVTAKLRGMRHLDVLDGAPVLGQLRQRSGVLRSPAEDRIDFVHRTFQEYLAAEEAAEEDHIGNLIERAHLDLWRETIIMTAGHANARQREELLGGILDRAGEEPRHARTLRLLAAACQETLPAVSDGLAERLDDAVKKLFPAKRKTDPPALAAVGPTLLRWLPRSLEELSEPAAARTVRTAALIGGEKALDLLAGYVGDEREEVVNELIKAWNYFDADVYADRVLCRLPLAGNLVAINHPGQMRAAARLRELTGVSVLYPLHGLEVLADLPPLRMLWVAELLEAADLSVLGNHLGLEDLVLNNTRALRGGAVLADLNRLRWLTARLPEDLDPRALRSCWGLTNVRLDGVAEKDLGPLTALAGLRFVELSGSGRGTLRGFDDLRGMLRLQLLRLEGLDIDPWLSRVSLSPALTDLYLSNCVVPPDPEVFLRFGHLGMLSLDGCRTPDGTSVTAPRIPGVRVRTR